MVVETPNLVVNILFKMEDLMSTHNFADFRLLKIVPFASTSSSSSSSAAHCGLWLQAQFSSIPSRFWLTVN
jgi:hypothetical protein